MHRALVGRASSRAGSSVASPHQVPKVAAVATGFPSGQYPLRTKLEEVRRTVADGADEIDMVIDRCAFLAGDHAKVFDEIAATREACGPASAPG
mgnify:CR=1 FL=1